ncbi:uncharacterized protein MONOS_15946 [Monocercomonoides exilis]|uniref:uncharacterized protein n=1 Tax=Monocercomonoides exilis TaxID=2049356 RepID=UPI0035594D75|nr:hypothetical protein MONOS_15946 [Monocercomonoides exilis]|eukprot:MONOS_15946.1-p1 / transcript=MONOS_15946.1 / gene=MONOS_15946 / organism=Monocercomonoides_exilis_PA203 / gene_product=unspecified product / transcript_product=unspecified product / location=Mono_scaffold01420:1058-2362(-) / protein_length=243 / sequence_SO=supercontig / SO=protein_coding / is_pseudo=false
MFHQFVIILRHERIEEAWKRGFDPEGAAYYKGKLVGSKKFIGAVEVYTFLSSLRISAKIVECQSSSDAAFKWLLDYFDRQGDASDEADRKTHHKGGAPFEKAEMHSSSTASSSTSPSSTLSTSLSSSSSSSSSLPQSSTDSSLILQETFCSPVFFQMEGHSKTVIGVDRCSVENVALLMLDPSTSTQYMKLPEIGKTINSLRHSKERFKKYGKKLQMLFVDSLTPLSDEVMEVRKTPRAIARL